VQLAICLPTYLGNVIDPRAVLDWARRSETAGFDAVGVHDRPHSDTLEPLATLAAVAAVTERVRLATTVILLPTRDEALVVKQAAVVDRISCGRLDLGVGVGGRMNDFEVFGRPFAGRGREFERQLARIDDLWACSVASEESGTQLGPAPLQRPRPPLWVGGYAPAAIDRAVRQGDGYIFGAAGAVAMAAKIPTIREAVAKAGRSDFPIAGLAYVLLSTSAGEIADAELLLTRYYQRLQKPFRDLVAVGDEVAMQATLATYREAGVDRLYLVPVSRSADQIERISAVAGLRSLGR
jgi:alkanesulfonate monooxygenase SsuD/methylene tetrahydromethanopterin reductase-like flavin-dependent oxidoreductase (luciferase family)